MMYPQNDLGSRNEGRRWERRHTVTRALWASVLQQTSAPIMIFTSHMKCGKGIILQNVTIRRKWANLQGISEFFPAVACESIISMKITVKRGIDKGEM